jgi:xanthosine utilization system XapX-like protein
MRPMLILALLPLALPAPPELVRVVLLGEYTPAETVAALERVRRAAAWWEQRAPAPVYAQVEQGATLAAPADLEAWLADIPPHDVYTVYIVKAPALPGGTHGAASHAMRLALVTYDAPLSPDAVMAHELGHLLYDLRHTCPSEGSDIMCNHIEAWRLGRLGCGTLAQLGAPCQRVGLPLMGGR